MHLHQGPALQAIIRPRLLQFSDLGASPGRHYSVQIRPHLSRDMRYIVCIDRASHYSLILTHAAWNRSGEPSTLPTTILRCSRRLVLPCATPCSSYRSFKQVTLHEFICLSYAIVAQRWYRADPRYNAYKVSPASSLYFTCKERHVGEKNLN